MSRDAHSMHRQMPLTHAEKYKLRIIWYWYPVLPRWYLFPRIHHLGDYRNDSWHLLRARRRGIQLQLTLAWSSS